MRKKKPRDIALSLLNLQSTRSGPWADDSLDEAFSRNPALDPRDKAFVSNLVHGVWRWRGRLDWCIARASNRPLSAIAPDVLNILRLALYQILFMDRVPDSAAVNEAVEQVKAAGKAHAASFINGVLRRLCRESGRISPPDPAKDPEDFLAVEYSYPRWLAARVLAAYGMEEAGALLEAMNRIPALHIRGNPLKTTREDLIRRLEAEGLEAAPLVSPMGLEVKGLRGRVDQLSCFQEGLFTVQDAGAQAVSCLLGVEPGERILDLCAGYGGKTTHLAELSGGRSMIAALDINHGRLVHLRRSANRLGLAGIHPVVADAAEDPVHLFRTRFHRILVDAPCSGLGVLSRHPDGKWNRSEEDVARLAGLQVKLLNSAADLLEEGGFMLYVTCTIAPEENEGVVETVLNKRRELSLQDLGKKAAPWIEPLVDSQGFYRALPHVHGTGGFFGAGFSKT
ncbi:MAG: 16S rRNA (cytosine(967)-C(5))-methyltransferase RsmB [Desulfobacteraceae bacterium]